MALEKKKEDVEGMKGFGRGGHWEFIFLQKLYCRSILEG